MNIVAINRALLDIDENGIDPLKALLSNGVILSEEKNVNSSLHLAWEESSHEQPDILFVVTHLQGYLRENLQSPAMVN